MCVKKMELERGGGSNAVLAPPLLLLPSLVHPILFSSPISIVLSANWELAGGKWSGRTDGQRMGRREGVRMNGAEREREERGYGAVSYMQIVFIVYDDFFHLALFYFFSSR